MNSVTEDSSRFARFSLFFFTIESLYYRTMHYVSRRCSIKNDRRARKSSHSMAEFNKSKVDEKKIKVT